MPCLFYTSGLLNLQSIKQFVNGTFLNCVNVKRILLCEENKAFTESFRTFIAMLQRLCSLRSMGKSIPRQSLRWLSSSSVPPPTPAIPPGLLQYLEKKEEEEESFGRSQSQLADLHSALRRYMLGSSKSTEIWSKSRARK